MIEKSLLQEAIWRGRLLDVWRDTVALPQGGTATREYIRHPGAVVVIALDDQQQVVMERQYRHPIGAVVDELPAGKLDPGEEPLRCAQRELHEETGYLAAQWRYLGSFWPCVGYSNEVIHVVFATELTAGTPACDDEERIEVYLLPYSELLKQVRLGQIRDGKTLAALWFVNAVLSG